MFMLIAHNNKMECSETQMILYNNKEKSLFENSMLSSSLARDQVHRVSVMVSIKKVFSQEIQFFKVSKSH